MKVKNKVTRVMTLYSVVSRMGFISVEYITNMKSLSLIIQTFGQG